MKKIIVISTSLRTGSNSDMLADQPMSHRQFAEISLAVGKEQRNYPHGSGRDYHSHRLLRRLA